MNSPPNPYATLDELLDKLFFVAVSGDGPFLQCRYHPLHFHLMFSQILHSLHISSSLSDDSLLLEVYSWPCKEGC